MASLADIILQGGRDQANSALQLAQIEADRRTANAQNITHSIATLADVFGKIPQQIAQNKRQAVEDESNKLQLTQQKDAIARTAKLRDLQQTYGSNPATFETALRSNGFTDEADKVQDHVLRTTASTLEAESAKSQQTVAATKIATAMLNGVHDDATLQSFKKGAQGIFQDPTVRDWVLSQVGDTYDPAKIDAAKQIGMSQSEIQAQLNDALQRTSQGLTNAHTIAQTQQVILSNAANLLASSKTPQAYLQHLAYVKQTAPSIADQFGQNGTPEDIAGAKAIAIGPTKQAELNIQQQEANARTTAARNAGGGATAPETIDAYVNQVRNGNTLIQNVPTNIRNAVVTKLGADGPRLTTQGKQMKETATTLLPLIDKVQGLAERLDKAGLLGTVAGRARNLASLESAAANMQGLTAEQRKLVGEFASAGGLLITGIARAHGGARAGGSPQMIEHLSSLMDAGNKDIQTFIGNLNGERDFMQAYAGMGEQSNATSSPGPPPANPKVGDPWQSPTGPTKWNGVTWEPK